ncbi:hypothetical protein SRABI83_04459 [Arthrobacter sp. Bi83]|nr:hypothetical protein SRABI83_04459 [Arthrobacter sp. Bi83]
MGSEEGLHPLHVGLVAFAPEIQVAERVPGDIATDPLALGPHDHRAGLELADAAERIPAAGVGEMRGRFLHLELEGQRDAAGGLGNARL